MISVAGISKSFGNVKAVDNLSFSIKEGEIVGLLGPNGAGKTTTMRILTGFLSPDAGQVEVNTINMAVDHERAQAVIGYMPENNPLYKDMLVSEMLEFVASVRQMSPKEKHDGIDFAVDSTNLKDVYYRPIAELSKGFRQRVGMAVVLLHRPSVLILDEPTEGLDPNQRTEVRTLIKQLAKGHTVLISTHVMQEVEAVCSRLIIIHKGKLVADGTAERLGKLSGNSAGLEITLEGDKIASVLKSLKGIEMIETVRANGKKVDLHIIGKKGVSLEPELTRLAGKHGWTIWKLTKKEQNLEEVFHQLTSGAI